MKAFNLKTLYAQASRWALPFLVVLLIFSFWNGCHKEALMGSLQGVVDSLEKQSVVLQNNLGKSVTQNWEHEVESRKQLKSLTDTIFDLKKADQRRVKEVERYARVAQQVTYKDRLATWTDTPHVTDTHVGDIPPQPADTNLIRIPRPFKYMDSTISFAGVVVRAGVRVDSINITNKLHLRTVTLSSGFMNWKRQTAVQAINENPAFTTTGITSLVVKDRVTWWHRWGKPVAFAVVSIVAYDRIRK